VAEAASKLKRDIVSQGRSASYAATAKSGATYWAIANSHLVAASISVDGKLGSRCRWEADASPCSGRVTDLGVKTVAEALEQNRRSIIKAGAYCVLD